MPHRDIVVIGASAGGLQALVAIVERLPATLRASILVVVHTRLESDGVLPQILSRSTVLPVAFAQTGDRLTPGHVYVSQPDHHLLVTEQGLQLSRGPRENGFRPAIDPLFRTAARQYGRRVIGVVLSGALSDGTYGLSVIKQHGGVAIVQDPEDAIVSSMPLSALNAVDVDLVLPAEKIAGAISELAGQGISRGGPTAMSRSDTIEPQLPLEETAIGEMEGLFGSPAALSCPDCGGALWEVKDRRLVRYQCHVGHQFAAEMLESQQRNQIDGALWTAVRVLEENAELKLRMARRAAEGGLASVSDGFEKGALDAREHAQNLRAVLFGLRERNGASKRPARTRKAPARRRSPASRTRKR